MTRTMFSGISALVALATAFGCGNRSPEFAAKIQLLPPAAVEDHVVLVDTGRAEARLLDVSGTAAPAAPVVVPLVKNATATQIRNGHTGQLLVLCAGQPDTSKDVTPEQPGLVVLDASGGSTTYRYDSPFDQMVQSDDGRYVFLFFGAASSDSTTLRNPNEVALIDLDQKNGKPTLKTLRSLGQSPQGVVFSPGTMNIRGVDRSLAVVLLERDVAVIDLSHLERSEFTIELTKPGDPPLTASEVLFSPDEQTPKIYLRADGSDDVFAVLIEGPRPLAAGDAGAQNENDFSLHLSPFGAGTNARPSDIALFQDGAETRVLVAAPGTNTAVVVNPDSTAATTISLPVRASRIQLFQGTKPSDSTVAERALLYDPGSSNVMFLDLTGLGTENNRSGNAELLAAPQAYAKLVPLGPETALLLHQGSGVSVLNLTDRSLSPISGPNVVDAVPDLPLEKLWLAPPGDRLGFLDLTNYHPNEVRLDATIEHFVRVPKSQKSGHPKIAVTHPSSVGYMTVLDADQPANLDDAYAISGYLFQGVLGGGQ